MSGNCSLIAPSESSVPDAPASTAHVADPVSAAHVSATAHTPAGPDNVGICIKVSVNSNLCFGEPLQ